MSMTGRRRVRDEAVASGGRLVARRRSAATAVQRDDRGRHKPDAHRSTRFLAARAHDGGALAGVAAAMARPLAEGSQAADHRRRQAAAIRRHTRFALSRHPGGGLPMAVVPLLTDDQADPHARALFA